MNDSERGGDQETAGNVELCVAFELADFLCLSSSHHTLFHTVPMCLLLSRCQHASIPDTEVQDDFRI